MSARIPKPRERFPFAPSSGTGGFTVVEVLIAAVLTALFVLLLTSFRTNLSFLSNTLTNTFSSTEEDVSRAVDVMTSQLRSAGPSSLGAYPIETAATSTFTFYSDINRDGLYERVRYFFASSSLVVGVVSPTGNPIQYVTSTEIATTVIPNISLATSTPLFSYYDSSYNGVTQTSTMPYPVNITQIRIVGVTFSANVAATGTTAQADSISFLVTLRNLRSN